MSATQVAPLPGVRKSGKTAAAFSHDGPVLVAGRWSTSRSLVLVPVGLAAAPAAYPARLIEISSALRSLADSTSSR